jgi:hypothetical protein
MTIPAANYLKASLIDTTAAGALTIGGTTATSVSIGKSGFPTNILGILTVAGNETESGSLLTSTIDTSAAGALTIGGTTATGVNIGASSTSVIGITGNTTITGNASITGNTTITAGSALKTTSVDVPTGSTLLTVAGTTATTLTLGQSSTTLNILGSGFYYASGPYTPTITGGTISATGRVFGSYNVIGKMMFLKIWVNTGATGGSSTASTYQLSIPSGYNINQVANSITPTLTGTQIVCAPATGFIISGTTTVGSGITQLTTTATYSYNVFAYNSTSICAYSTVNGTDWFWGNSSGAFTLANANMTATFECSLPLV